MRFGDGLDSPAKGHEQVQSVSVEHLVFARDEIDVPLLHSPHELPQPAPEGASDSWVLWNGWRRKMGSLDERQVNQSFRWVRAAAAMDTPRGTEA